MLLKSMRDANKSFGDSLFGSDQADFYQDMFDDQLAMHWRRAGPWSCRHARAATDAQRANAGVPTGVQSAGQTACLTLMLRRARSTRSNALPATSRPGDRRETSPRRSRLPRIG